MTCTQRSPHLATSKKKKRRKRDTEHDIMESDTEDKSATIKGFDSTTHTSVDTISARVSVETLISDRTLDHLVSVKIETDEWYNTAAGFYSECAKSEQVPWEETHPDCNKQVGFNLEHEHTGCLRLDQDCIKQDDFISECVKSEQIEYEVMHQDVTRQACVNSVFVKKNTTANSNAYTAQDELHSVCEETKQSLNANTDQSYITTNSLNSVCGSNISKEADDRLLLRSWYALPSENYDVHAEEGSGMDVKPVVPTPDMYTLQGNGQHGRIVIPSSRSVQSSVSPSVPSVDSQPTDPAHTINIPLPSPSPQRTHPYYYQQQQPQLVTTVKTRQCGAMAEPVFDEKHDSGEEILEENKLMVLNALQLSQFGSQQVLLDFVNGQFMPSVPHSSSDLTPVIHFTAKTEAHFVCTLPVQVLPTSVSIHSVISSSVTAGNFTSTDAVAESAWKSVKKDGPSNQSIGLSSDVILSMDQKVALLPVNAPHVPMGLVSCDSKSNLLQDISESQSNEMPLSVSFKMAEFAVTSESEINSNLAAESVESSSDDFVEIFIERNKRKSKSNQSTHPAPKRFRGQGSSRGIVESRESAENAVTRTVRIFRKPAKMKLNEKGDRVKKGNRMKKAKTPEKDKTEYSLQERNLASCMNLEPRDNDLFLYCGECIKEFEGDCPVHGPLNFIQDKEVPEGHPLKADHTLPDGLEIKNSQLVGAGLGVFSKVGLESRIMFGPYGGDIITDNHKSGYCWQIYTDGKASHFVDAQNKATSNWMRYVNCAVTKADQNLVALQYKGGIYYFTLKPVSPGEELLVWYGDEFARELGLIRDDNLLGSYSSKNSSHLKTHMMMHTEKRPYKCEMCDYACNRSGLLKIHMRIHTGERPYKCEVCDYACTANGSLTEHMRIHTGERPYKCEECDYACNGNGDLKKHMRMHTGERPYKCDECGNAFKFCSNLKKHMRIHTGERPYKCKVCDYACSRSGDLKTHMRIHTGERPYKCEVCDYACSRRGDLKTHMRIHTGERLYKCEECDYACNQRGNLKTHMRIHTGERLYECKKCDYACSRRGDLKTHMRIHTGEGLFKCEECDYACYQRGHLTEHMRIHKGERPYKCDECDYACNQRGNLKRHMRIHTGERPYTCEMCDYACNESGNLKTHMRIHTGERPFKCKVCRYACKTSGNLTEHMRIHTGERP